MARSIAEKIAEAETKVAPGYAAALRDLDEDDLHVVIGIMARVEQHHADEKATIDEYQQAKARRLVDPRAFAAFVGWRQDVLNPIEADLRAWSRLALLHLEARAAAHEGASR